MWTEQRASQHLLGIPVLISPLWLRRKGVGQVDLAYLKGEMLHLVEVKRLLDGWRVDMTGQQAARLENSRTLLDTKCRWWKRTTLELWGVDPERIMRPYGWGDGDFG